MSDKVLHEWTEGQWLRQIDSRGKYERSRKIDLHDAPSGWSMWTSPLEGSSAEIARLAAENERLRAPARFGLKCFDEHRDQLGDLDGSDLQEWAEECGLLHEVHVTEPCGENCRCVEWDDFPQECLRETDLVTEARKALENQKRVESVTISEKAMRLTTEFQDARERHRFPPGSREEALLLAVHFERSRAALEEGK